MWMLYLQARGSCFGKQENRQCGCRHVNHKLQKYFALCTDSSSFRTRFAQGGKGQVKIKMKKKNFKLRFYC